MTQSFYGESHTFLRFLVVVNKIPKILHVNFDFTTETLRRRASNKMKIRAFATYFYAS